MIWCKQTFKHFSDNKKNIYIASKYKKQDKAEKVEYL